MLKSNSKNVRSDLQMLVLNHFFIYFVNIYLCLVKFKFSMFKPKGLKLIRLTALLFFNAKKWILK